MAEEQAMPQEPRQSVTAEELTGAMEQLKTTETDEKSTLPQADDIQQEKAAMRASEETLGEAKRKLSSASTEEKSVLPTPEDIAAEKKDDSCAVGAGGYSGSSQMSKAAESKKKAEEKSANLGALDAKNQFMGGAGSGGGFGLNAPGYGMKPKGPGVAAHKKQIDVDDAIANAWNQVMDDNDPLKWVYCKYSADSKKLELQATGTGGMSEFKGQIGDDLAWGAFKCFGVDKRGGTEVRRTKFIFVQVKPEGASVIKKSKQATHKADVKEAIHGAHLDIVIESAADLDPEGMIGKLQAATGAHKPNGYEFDEGNFIEADFYGLGIGKDCKGETAAS